LWKTLTVLHSGVGGGFQLSAAHNGMIVDCEVPCLLGFHALCAVPGEACTSLPEEHSELRGDESRLRVSE
jgi:hypothetical protein